MLKKKPITILLTQNQAEKLKDESKKTGNSQNSIIRTALEKYFTLKDTEGGSDGFF